MSAVLLAIALLVALPQGDVSTATASLGGYVRDAASHAPIPRAFVVLSAAGERTVTVADGEGRFAFAGLAPGRYNLAAVAEGFAVDPATGPVAVVIAGRATAVDIAMTRAAVISTDAAAGAGRASAAVAA